MNLNKGILRQKIVEPLHGLIKRSNKLPYWRQLEKTQFWPEDRLRKIQWQRFNKLAHYLWEKNDFYRKVFQKADFAPSTIKNNNDLKRLPILSKEDIRNNAQAMISRDFHINDLQMAKTGGSTGKALEIYFTEECSEYRNACARRHDRWTGWEPGEPIAACWGNPKLPTMLKDKIKQWALQPIIYLDTMNVNEETIKSFVYDWEKIQPTLLYGHAHSIFILSEYLRMLNIRSLKPRGILSTSMMLMPAERKSIEAQFKTKVIDRYGCEEVSLIACECEKHEGMHLNIEHLIIEFIKNDGKDALPGESGNIVVTDLMNYAMPLIRYKVEDVGVPTIRICSCGRGLPLMEHVEGRVADFLVKRDGTKVAGVSMIENTLTRFKGIIQMQIVQKSIDDFLVRIVQSSTVNSDIVNLLRNYFKKIFGEGIKIEIEVVKTILPEKSGKYRFSICLIDKE